MYKIKNLNYDIDSLKPYISENTMTKHYNYYTDKLMKLNQLLPNTNYTLIELFDNIDEFPIDIRGEIMYNAGSVLNHELYFNNINPNKNNQINGKIKKDIENQYGTFENFKNEFVRQANLLTGSGYTFLVVNKNVRYNT